MEKLMKPAEYAKELGISRQAVYAKIKKGILRSKSVEGKLYIVVDSSETSRMISNAAEETKTETAPAQSRDYVALLKAKDETIEVLKGTVRDLKESNREISTTLKGEIELLKEAFHEMRTLYVHQLEQKKPKMDTETIEILSKDELWSDQDKADTASWVGVKKFLKHLGIDEKKEKIIKRLKKAYKKGDSRVTKIDGKLKIDPNENYEDILYR